MKQNIYQRRKAEIQSKTYIWAKVFLLPIVKPVIRRSLSFFFAAGSILLHFKVHLLGKPRYTLTERLLANLTDLLAISLWPVKMAYVLRRSSTLLPGPFLASSRPCLSHASTHDSHGTLRMKDYYGISQKIFGAEDVKTAHFKKIKRV